MQSNCHLDPINPHHFLFSISLFVFIMKTSGIWVVAYAAFLVFRSFDILAEAKGDEGLSTKINQLDKKISGLLESNRIFQSGISDWIIQNRESRDDGMLKLLGKIFGKSASFVNSSALGRMTLTEIEEESQKLNGGFPKEADLRRELDGKVYQIITNKVGDFSSFKTEGMRGAEESCHERNSTLLTIKSKKVNDFIKSWIFDELKMDEITGVWLNLTRIGVTNNFKWGDGTELVLNESNEKGFRNWAKGHPLPTKKEGERDRGDDDEIRAVVMTNTKGEAKSGEWMTVSYWSRSGYIVVCQK